MRDGKQAHELPRESLTSISLATPQGHEFYGDAMISLNRFGEVPIGGLVDLAEAPAPDLALQEVPAADNTSTKRS